MELESGCGAGERGLENGVLNWRKGYDWRKGVELEKGWGRGGEGTEDKTDKQRQEETVAT